MITDRFANVYLLLDRPGSTASLKKVFFNTLDALKVFYASPKTSYARYGKAGYRLRLSFAGASGKVVELDRIMAAEKTHILTAIAR